MFDFTIDFDEKTYAGPYKIEYIKIDDELSLKELKNSDNWCECITLVTSSFRDVLRYVYSSDKYKLDNTYLLRVYPYNDVDEAIYFFKSKL